MVSILQRKSNETPPVSGHRLEIYGVSLDFRCILRPLKRETLRLNIYATDACNESPTKLLLFQGIDLAITKNRPTKNVLGQLVSNSFSGPNTFQILLEDKLSLKAYLGHTLSKKCSGPNVFQMRFWGKHWPKIVWGQVVSRSVSGSNTFQKLLPKVFAPATRLETICPA